MRRIASFSGSPVSSEAANQTTNTMDETAAVAKTAITAGSARGYCRRASDQSRPSWARLDRRLKGISPFELQQLRQSNSAQNLENTRGTSVATVTRGGKRVSGVKGKALIATAPVVLACVVFAPQRVTGSHSKATTQEAPGSAAGVRLAAVPSDSGDADVPGAELPDAV